MKRVRINTEEKPPWFDENAHIKRKIIRFFIHIFAWTGMAVIFYVGFSFFFDTPIEYRMKTATRQLESEYEALAARFDTVVSMLDNIEERDRAIFVSLFESEPYDLDDAEDMVRWQTYEQLLTKSNRELTEDFERRSASFFERVDMVHGSVRDMMDKIDGQKDGLGAIPAVQPVVNRDLTLLTASFGMRINPFYKLLAQHNGVDFSVPVGTRVFATADGVVSSVSTKGASTGKTVTISHGSGYVTTYANLDKILVVRNQRVKRGDIIALSGDSGQSLAPHLHYEVSKNGMRVDPVHYFFMELSPADYSRIMRIAESGMQSFD